MKHKWAKEIKAWADGAEIEENMPDVNGEAVWEDCSQPDWSEYSEYRIKPQPKEPQYLYVYADEGGINFSQWHTEFTNGVPYIGKIKLEQDDVDSV